MQSKPKSNSVITHIVDMENQVITYNVIGCEPLVFDVKRVSDQCGERAMIHGFIQRISDAAAISRDPDTGKPATPQDKRERMARLVEHYMSGAEAWSPARAEGGARDEGLTITAMGDVYHKLAEECRDMVKQLAVKRGIDERAALAVFAKSAQIAARMAEIKAERAKDGPDADDLLAELDT